MNKCEVIKISFLLLGLFGENVAVISVFSLDFPVPVSAKRFLAPELVLSFAILQKIYN